MWSSTTTALANASSSTSTWPKAVPPSPRSDTTVGRDVSVSLGTVTTVARSKTRVGTRGDAVARHAGATQPRVVATDGLDDHLGRCVDLDENLAVAGAVVLVQVAQPVERGEPPLLLAPGRDGEVGEVVGREAVAPAVTGQWRRAVRVRFAAEPTRSGDRISAQRRWFGRSYDAQPTAPSICSSISRLSSRAYSIGSSLAIGSTKPRTIIAIASSSVRPRLIR